MDKSLYTRILEKSPFGYALHKVITNDKEEITDIEYVDVNTAYLKILKKKKEEVLSKRISEVIPEIKKEKFSWIKSLGEVGITGKPKIFERYVYMLNRYLLFKVYSPRSNYLVTIVTDITKEYIFSKVSNKFSSIKSQKTRHDLIAKSINKLYNAKFVIVVENNDLYNISNIKTKSMTNKNENIFKQILGNDVFEKKYKIIKREGFKEGIKEYKDFKEIKTCIFEKKQIERLYKQLDIHKIVVSKTLHETNISYDIILGFSKNDSIKDYTVLKSYTHMLELFNYQYEKDKSIEDSFDIIKKFFDVSLNLFAVLNKNGDFINVNNRWRQLLNCSEEKLIRSNFSDFIHDDDKAEFKEALKQIQKKNKILNYIVRFKCGNQNEYKYTEWRILLYEEYIFASGRNITDTIKLEKQLKENENILYTTTVFTQELLLNNNYRKAVKNTLPLLGEAIDADRVYLFKNEIINNQIFAKQLEEWCSEYAKPQIDNENLQKYPLYKRDYIFNKFKNKEFLSEFTNRIEDKIIKKEFISHDIKSILVIPILVRDNLWGFVGFDQCRYEREWRDEEKNLLKMYANSLASSIETNEAEVRANEIESRNAALLKAIPDAMVIIDNKNRIIDYKGDNGKNLHLKTNKYLYKNLIEVLPNEMANSIIDNLVKVRKTNETFIFDAYVGNDDNRYFEIRLVPCGKELILGIIRDVTEKKIAEKTIFESEKKFHDLAEESPISIISCDKNGNIEFLNNEAKNKLKKIKNSKNENIFKILGIEYRNKDIKVQTIEKEYIISKKDKIYFKIYINPQFKEKKLIGYRIILDNITSLKKTHTKLKESMNILKEIVNILPGLLLVVDKDFNLILKNKALIEKIGKVNENNCKCYKYLFNKNKRCNNCIIQKVINENIESKILTTKLNIDNYDKTYRTFISPIYDDQNRLYGYIKYAIDISDFENAKRAAEKANKAKTAFLANMSHEIRTPINGILGFLQILEKEGLNDEQKEYINDMKISANILTKIISNILDISKIESGKYELEKEKFNLHNTIKDSLLQFKTMAAEKNLDYNLLIEDSVEKYVIGDAVKYKQILGNITNNAFKFTNIGSIEIYVSMKKKKGKVVLKTVVKDTGIGIKKNKIKEIFAPFNQGDNSATRQFSGTGLGLTICKSLIELMNGDIEIESEVGKGTKITFNVEFISFKNTKKKVEFKNKKIVLVDASNKNTEIIEYYIGKYNNIIVFKSYNDAVSYLVNGNKADYIIVADNAKDMSVLEFTNIIDSIENLKFIPKILLRSFISVNHIKGFYDSILEKPYLKDELIKALFGEELASENIIEDDYVNLNSNSNSISNLKVLVAEDNRINRKFICKLLERLEIKCEVACDGQEAYNKAVKNKYDVIFMDCQMPVVDGYKATEKIRKAEEKTNNHTIIIAMTANAMDKDKDICIKSGMDDYIPKPVFYETIVDVLNKWRIC